MVQSINEFPNNSLYLGIIKFYSNICISKRNISLGIITGMRREVVTFLTNNREYMCSEVFLLNNCASISDRISSTKECYKEIS